MMNRKWLFCTPLLLTIALATQANAGEKPRKTPVLKVAPKAEAEKPAADQSTIKRQEKPQKTNFAVLLGSPSQESNKPEPAPARADQTPKTPKMPQTVKPADKPEPGIEPEEIDHD